MTAPLEIDTYHSDAPISDPREDAFDRWPFARRISEMPMQRLAGSVRAAIVYGSWGEGKSTVLKFIERELGRHADVHIIHFNPWRFRTEDDLFVGFFSALAGGIGQSLKTRRERAAKAVAPYTKILSPISIGVGVVNVSAGQLTKSLTEAASADVDTVKARLDKLIKDSRSLSVSACDGVSGSSQLFCQFQFHLHRGFKRHWVEVFVKLWHQPHAIFPHYPSRFVAVFVIFKSVIDGDSCHSNINARLQWITSRIQP